MPNSNRKIPAKKLNPVELERQAMVSHFINALNSRDLSLDNKRFSCDLLHLTVMNNNIITANALLSWEGIDIDIMNDMKMTPLAMACVLNHSDMVKFLISKGAKVDGPQGSQPPLACAAYMGHDIIVDILLEYNASVHRRTVLGDTPLLCSLMKIDNGSSREMIMKLVRKGGDLNDKMTNGISVLMLAIFKDDLPAFNYIISEGVDIHHGVNIHVPI